MSWIHHLSLVPLLAAFATGQAPLIQFEFRDLGPSLMDAVSSRGVVRLFDGLNLRWMVGAGLVPAHEEIEAATRLACGRTPERLAVTVPAQSGASLVAVLKLRTALRALSADHDVEDEAVVRALARLRAEFEGAVRELAGMRASALLQWEQPRMAEQGFSSLVAYLSAALAELPEDLAGLIRVESADERFALVVDVDAWLGDSGGPRVLRTLGLVHGEDDPLVELLGGAVAPGREPALVIRRVGAQVALAVAPGEASNSVMPDVTVAAGPLLSARWSTTAWRDALESAIAFVEDLRRSPLASRIDGLDSDLECLRVTASLLRHAGPAGRAAVTRSSDRLELALDVERPSSGSSAADGSLLARMPADAEVWYASEATDLPEAIGPALAALLAPVHWLSMLSELRTDPDAETRRGGFAAPIELAGVLHAQLAAPAPGFVPGAALVLTAEGAFRTDAGVSVAPAIALLGRPESDEAGLRFARLVLEPIATAMGVELESGEREIHLAPRPPWIDADAEPHAFLFDDLLVLSSSRRLSERIRATASRSFVGGRPVARLETSGRRLGDLCQWCVPALFGLTGPTNPWLADTIGVSADALGLLGAIHSESTVRGDELHTEFVVHLAPAERDAAEDSIERVRDLLASSEWPEDRMLVARGAAVCEGQPTRFTFTFGPRDEFRLSIPGATGLEAVFDGEVLRADFGHGMLRLDGLGAHPLRGWAAGVSGRWIAQKGAFEPQFHERTREVIALRYSLEDDPIPQRILIDAESMLPYAFDQNALFPVSAPVPTRLSDYRDVDGRRLPFHIVSEEGNEYRVEAWESVPFAAATFTATDSPRFRFAPGAGPLVLDSYGDWILARGRVGGRDGPIGVAPLRLDALVDRRVAADAPTSANGTVELEDVRIGPLRAERFRFHPTEIPTVRGEQVLALVGTQALECCCVRVSFPEHRVELLPPGSFDGDGMWAMCSLEGHRAFAGRLRGDVPVWWAPMADGSRVALLKPFGLPDLLLRSRQGDGPLTGTGQIPFVDLAGARVAPAHTIHQPIWLVHDGTPMALGSGLLDGMTLELDFPNDRYRIVRTK